MSASVDSASTAKQVRFLDIVDPAFDFSSADMTAAQAENWYAETPVGLLVLRYAEAQEILRDPRAAHDGKGYLELNGVVDGPIYDWFVPMIANRDGADHRRLRGLVNKALTPRMVDDLRPFVRSRAEELADRIASLDVCDFVDDFANPLPLAVMSRLLGVAAEDFDRFRAWTTDIGFVFGLAHGGDIVPRVEAAVVGLTEYVDSLIEAKKAEPADDLVTALVAAQQVEGRVTIDELRNLVVTLVFAAHDTTRHQLSNAMVAFAAHHDQWTLLGRRPELAARAVDEVIRWCPSSSVIHRVAAEDFDFGGLRIAKGRLLMVAVAAAQRDPRVFRDGDRFDITATREAPVLQFGGGPHYCLGAALARVELGEALPVLAARLGPPTIAGPVTWRPPIGIHGPNELPLRFD